MDVKFSLKNLFVITGIAIVGILLAKWAINKASFVPDGIKASVNAV